MKDKYLETVDLIGRLHHRLLDLVKNEFDRMDWADINPTQALLMFNLGDQELSIGQLKARGYYLGTNVSYNLTKLEERQYIVLARSTEDRRSVRVKLTPKGQEVAEVVDELFDRHLKAIGAVGGITTDTIEELGVGLGALDRFLVHQATYRL